MEQLDNLTAKKLLQIKAIKLQPSDPFTWASGWKAPIYCDSRKLMSYPALRNYIKTEFAHIILEKYPATKAIAGVATGAIAPAAIVADMLGLPFVYIRSTAKGHGMKKQIEGDLQKDQNVIVIEDLISTGKSSLNVVNALRDMGCEVNALLAIFTYGFPQSIELMQNAKVEVTTLCNYNAILEEALAINYIKESDLPILTDWRKHPETWGQE